MAEDRKKLGEILVAEGIVSPEQIERAVTRQDEKGKKLGKVLVDMGLTTEEEIAAALCKQLGLRFERIENRQPAPETLKLLDKNFVTKNLMVPLEAADGKLVVAVSDPLNYKALDEAAHATGMKIEPVISTEKDILGCIERTYKINDIILHMLKEFRMRQDVRFVALPQNEDADVPKFFSVSDSSPAIKLLAFIFMDAFNKNANDIYIEPAADKLDVRYRIEGDLYNVISMPGSITDTLLHYLKLIANLDLAKNNFPQFGRSEVSISGKSVELELSTLPMINGERVKIRLRYKDRPAPTFGRLGTPPETVEKLMRLAGDGQGLILFSGPRNSGKRSAMYALLQEFPKDRKDIVAVEARAENRLEDITQVSFGEGDRAARIRDLLRQGPDVVMIDELKDAETARLAFEAANSGALVLASVQAKSAADAISRVLNFGLEPWLVASNLLAVTSQRLIRKTCPHCQEVYEPEIEHLLGLGFDRPDEFRRGAGCRLCYKSGYRGHEGLLQVTPVNTELRERIVARSGGHALFQAVADAEGISLLSLAWEKVRSGATTPEEALEKAAPGLLRPLTSSNQNHLFVPPGARQAAREPRQEESAASQAPRTRKASVQKPPAPRKEKPAEHPGEDGKGADTPRKKVLLAMADGRERDEIRKAMAGKDMDIILSPNGSDSLKTIYAENPDLLVCDLFLPGLDGLTAYKRLYDSSRKMLPVITISSTKTNLFSEEETLLRADFQLKRPLNIYDLMEKAVKLLEEQAPKRDWKVL